MKSGTHRKASKYSPHDNASGIQRVAVDYVERSGSRSPQVPEAKVPRALIESWQ
jgi:hypothetical protein